MKDFAKLISLVWINSRHRDLAKDGWERPALVDDKATYIGHCRQGELKREWESHRVQTYEETMTKTKTTSYKDTK